MNRFSIDKKNLPWWSPSGDGQTATTTCSACLQTRRSSLHGLTSEAMVFKYFCTHLCCLAQTSCWWLRILPDLKPSGTTDTKVKLPLRRVFSFTTPPLYLWYPRCRLDEPHVRFGHIGDEKSVSRHFLAHSAGILITALSVWYLDSIRFIIPLYGHRFSISAITETSSRVLNVRAVFDAHLAFYSVSTGIFFSGDRAAGAWFWPLTSIWLRS